jgi:hypothetical protein
MSELVCLLDAIKVLELGRVREKKPSEICDDN